MVDGCCMIVTPPLSVAHTLFRLHANRGHISRSASQRLLHGGDPACTGRLERALQRNCFGKDTRAAALPWGDGACARRLVSSLGGAPDLVLCADLVYRAERAAPLAATLLALRGPQTRVLVCQDRHSDEAWAAFLCAVRCGRLPPRRQV